MKAFSGLLRLIKRRFLLGAKNVIYKLKHFRAFNV